MAKKHTQKTIREIAINEVTLIDDAVIKTVREVEIRETKTMKKTKEYWNVLGPGLTTGASDDDPSGIATYSQTGAQYGFGLLWLGGLSFSPVGLGQEKWG